ncbi:MAG: RNA 2',3'-cyclic phosphodiesterase [candidate division Zixibacteria bacterium]|nr:RNA 2',3'-cyclic phosphodiesterase [candidate division Zixibacteria bacterium]
MRLFIALPLPKEVEEELGRIIFALKQKGPRIKWVTPKNVHLTVKFLGETPEKQVEAITDAVRQTAAGHTVITCATGGLGAFPNLKRPRVYWVGLTGQIDRLQAIARDMDEHTARLGFERENRPFKPHLTLGRVRESYGLDDLAAYIENYEFTPQPVILDRLVLFKSTLTPRGPIYDRLCESPLATP